MVIKLMRHGESMSNLGDVRPHESGDARVGLSPRGVQQATEAGHAIGREFIEQSLVYCSPYLRTRETLAQLLIGAAGSTAQKVYEDPRLREVERGYIDEESQRTAWATHGWFYYRHSGGESAADCYDRTSAFLESMMRQVKRHDASSVLIVTHGMVIRCFVARFLHLHVEQFESMANPNNCDVVTLAPIDELAEPVFSNGRWGVEGLRLRENS